MRHLSVHLRGQHEFGAAAASPSAVEQRPAFMAWLAFVAWLAVVAGVAICVFALLLL
jgi:hypothetical protein